MQRTSHHTVLTLDALKTFLQPVEIQPPSLSGHYQLWQLRPLARCLAEHAAKILILALTNTRLDYCNSLYLGLSRWFDEPPAVSSEPPQHVSLPESGGYEPDLCTGLKFRARPGPAR